MMPQGVVLFLGLPCGFFVYVSRLHKKAFAAGSFLHRDEEQFMEEVTYKTQGTCAKAIHFTRTDDGKITGISFDGGCNGNLKAISKLCDGMTAEEISGKLRGNTCGAKSTSCADQLARAVMQQ